MTVNEQIAILLENRLMATQEQIWAFDAAVQLQLREPTPAELVRLLLVFDDATEHFEVMWGLIHYVENAILHYPMEVYVNAVVNALPAMNARASEWAEILLIRILNHEPSRMALEEYAQNAASSEERTALRKTLQQLTGHSDHLAASAQDLLSKFPEGG